MFWVDRDVEQIKERFASEIASKTRLILRDEKTASGKVHVGSLRGIAIHDLVARVLRENDIDAVFQFEINEFDPMDGLPSYLSEEDYKEHMGKPLMNVPSPDPSVADSFAEYYGNDFKKTIEDLGFKVEFTQLYPKYKAGEFNDVIRTALEKAADIRAIYREVSGSEKADDWYPLQVVCPDCGKIGTTKVTAFDGEKVTYECREDLVEWATGCGGSGDISPFDGNAKLPWKVEWAAKWKVYGVHIEGAGKDHNAAGGSRDISGRIAKEVFDYFDPYDIKYEHILSGGKKMSSSKGIGATASDMSTLLPTELIRILLIGADPKQAAEFDPSGDTVPKLFDRYDELAKHYFGKQAGELHKDFVRQFELIHPEGVELINHYLPDFSQIVFLSQMPDVDVHERVQEMKESDLNEAGRAEVDHRLLYAKAWIEKAAPEQYVYKVQKNAPEGLEFSDIQKTALGRIADLVEEGKKDEELHSAIFELIKEELNAKPKEIFQAIYQSLLGRDSGPKAGWFLSALDADLVVKRFRECSSS